MLNAGWLIAYDPLLCVSSAHRQRGGVRSYYKRIERETRELAAHDAFPPFGLRDAFEEWWRGYLARQPLPATGPPRQLLQGGRDRGQVRRRSSRAEDSGRRRRGTPAPPGHDTP